VLDREYEDAVLRRVGESSPSVGEPSVKSSFDHGELLRQPRASGLTRSVCAMIAVEASSLPIVSCIRALTSVERFQL
jgi:hypothetical protein